MISRDIFSELEQLAQEYKVITVTGPRQSGKTTLVRSFFPEYKYVNLEDPDVRELAQLDARGFLDRYSAPVILDEIQCVPELLNYIQVLVDRDDRKASYILTGSHQPALQARVTQSLAGRTALLELLPLSLRELMQSGQKFSRDGQIVKGFMPQLYSENIDVRHFYRNYYRTYVERDVRQLMNLRHLSKFELFIKLLAGRIGQLLNLSSLSNDIGVSVETLSGWLSILEASYVVFRLPPYYENFGKRLIKTPKLYFYEVGLASYLLGIDSPELCQRDPLMGSLFENMIVLEALKTCYNHGQESNLYFFRDSNGVEVDLLYARGRELFPIEIKSAMTFHSDFMANIRKFCSWSKRPLSGAVVYAGKENLSVNGVAVTHFSNTAELIQRFL